MKLNFTEDISNELHSKSKEQLLEELQSETLLDLLDISGEISVYNDLKRLDKRHIEKGFNSIIRDLNKDKIENIEYYCDFDKELIKFNPFEEFRKDFEIMIKYSDKNLSLSSSRISKSENIKNINISKEFYEDEEFYIQKIHFQIKFPNETPQGNYCEYISLPKNFNSKTYFFRLKCDGGITFDKFPKNLEEFGSVFKSDENRALDLFNSKEFKQWLRYENKSVNKLDNKSEADLYERLNNGNIKSIKDLNEFLKIIEIVSSNIQENSHKKIDTTKEYKTYKKNREIIEKKIEINIGVSGKSKIDNLIDMKNYKYQITNKNDLYLCTIESNGSIIIKQHISPIERKKIKIAEGIKSKSNKILKSLHLINSDKINEDKLSMLREDLLEQGYKILIRAIPNDINEPIKIFSIEIVKK